MRDFIYGHFEKFIFEQKETKVTKGGGFAASLSESLSIKFKIKSKPTQPEPST
jgi:hypothetical protein